MTTELTVPAGSEDGEKPLPGRVLIVDDEPAILFAYKRIIRGEGYDVDTCEGLDEALNFIAANAYFAVITDIRLSGTENTGGIQLFQAVRTIQPLAKVIVVTGFGDSEVKRTLDELGSAHYFEKPVKPSLIIELLKAFKNAVDEQIDDFDFEISLPELSEAECL